MAQKTYTVLTTRDRVSRIEALLYKSSHITLEQPSGGGLVKVYVKTYAPAWEIDSAQDVQRDRLDRAGFSTTLI